MKDKKLNKLLNIVFLRGFRLNYYYDKYKGNNPFKKFFLRKLKIIEGRSSSCGDLSFFV